MRRLLALTSVFLFAAGMAVAQDSTPSTMSGTQQPTVDSNNLRGCLTAGGDQFKLTTDVGAKVVNLNVDKKAATPYVAHEVEVQGMTTPDGNFRVDRIVDIADHCGHTGQPTTADSGAKSVTDANAGQQTNLAAASSAPESTQTAQPSSAAASATTTTVTPDTSAAAANPNVANPSTNPDQPAAASTQAANPPASTDMTAQNAQQSAVAAPAAQPVPDSNAVATEQKPADQNAVPSTSTQSSTTTTTTDQNAASTTAQTSTAAADQSAKSELPQTGSPLPLLGLLGLGSVAAGIVSRKRK